MQVLIDILTRETQTLREMFIEKSLEYAQKEYNQLKERNSWGPREWCKLLGLTPQERKYGVAISISFPTGFYNTSNAKLYDKLSKQAMIVERVTLNEYLDQKRKDAQIHYENSIVKLAARLKDKGLDNTKLSAQTSHIGVNIDTTLTDGNKTVRAFTILATGEINAPHYRYLIK